MRVLHTLAPLVALTLALTTSLASAQPAAPSQEQIDKAKASASAISGSLTNLALQRDANGEIKKDANGVPLTQKADSNAMRDGMRQFQDTIGLQGLEQVSSPAANGRTGLVKINVNSTFDFQCRPGATLSSAGALAFRLSNCDPQRGVQVEVCDKPASGGTCAAPSDFQAPVQLPPNVFSQLGEMQLGLACNDQNACRLTVKGTYAVGGNDESLKRQSQQAGASSDSSLVGTLRTAVVDGDYAGKMKEVGTDFKKCFDANDGTANPGQVMNCDGQPAISVSSSATNNYCTGTRECLKEALSTQTFTRTCTRTFPLTERISQLQYNTTRTCTLVERTQNGKTELIDDCAATTDPQTGEQLTPDARTGLTRVGEREALCTAYAEIDEQRVCVERTKLEYFVDMREVAVVSQSASPAAVNGQCDTRPDSDTRFTTCANGTWFGRTATAAECTVQFIDDRGDASTNVSLELNYTDKAGCGFCLAPTVGETCYGQPSITDEEDSCAGAQLEGCTFVSAKPRSYTGEGNSGLVSAQEETYKCVKETRTCVSWSKGTGDTCLSSDSAMGLDTLNPSAKSADGSLNSALVAAAVLDSTGRGIEGETATAVPKIFSGNDMRCKRATGGIGQLFGRNCCRTDLERPIGRQLTRGGCNMDAARLAAARRSHYATYIGDYCSRKMRFPRRCLERTETYCTFPGILPRLVQEQGRAQLAQMASSSVGADIQRGSLNFSYYDQGGGSWSPEALVNGVRLRAWQWPAYCSNPELAGERLATDPQAKDCPGVLSTWIAACDNPQGCGELPAEPAEGSLFWSMRMVDPLVNVTSAVSRYSVVQGACTPATNRCSYTVSAWPIGVGGKAVVTRDINWPLYLNEQSQSAAVAPQLYQMNNIADLMFRGYSVPGMNNGQLPATVRLDFSRDGGQTWSTHQLPTNQRAQDFTLPGSDVTITGYCDALTNICGYRIAGTTTVTAKPWGTPQWPDCSGFTAGQLAALDFGKMDLSEWLNTVVGKAAGAQTDANLAGVANRQFQEYNAIFANGGTVQQKASAPVAANFARVVPSEGFGPFDTRLVVSGYWPEITGDPALDRDRVTKVIADWGDCSAPEVLEPVPLDQGFGFRAVHRFEAPDSFACLGKPQRNVTHKVKLTVYTTMSGVQHRTLNVENAWATFPGGSKNNDFVGSSTTGNGYTTAPSQPPRP